MSKISVDLITHSNDELLIVNAARVSMNKHHDVFNSESDPKLLGFLLNAKPYSHWTPFAHPQIVIDSVLSWDMLAQWSISATPGSNIYIIEKSKNDAYFVQRGSLWFWINQANRIVMPNNIKKTVNNYVVYNYPTVSDILNFSRDQDPSYGSAVQGPISDDWICEKDLHQRSKLVTMTFRVTVPQAIKIQMYKHKYGFVESEVSRRYVKDDLEFIDNIDWYSNTEYLDMFTWREAADNVKQGSSDNLVEDQQSINDAYKSFCVTSNRLYQKLIHNHRVAPEQARFIQPMGSLTSFYWTSTLSDLYRFYVLRSDTHSQEEIREVAFMIDDHIKSVFPRSWNSLKGF